MLSKLARHPNHRGQTPFTTDKLFRYMPEVNARQWVENGDVRVSASTKFTEGEGLSYARQDDEQNKSVSVRGSGSAGLTSQMPPGFRASAYDKEIASGTLTTITGHVEDPYWILSMSSDLTLELFDTFGESAAVEVFDPPEFLRRVNLNSPHLQWLGGRIHAGFVQYFGEQVAYGYAAVRVPLFFSKSSQFASQKEFRVVWHPKYPLDGCHDNVRCQEGLKDISRVVLREDVKNGLIQETRFPDDIISRIAKGKREPTRRYIFEAGDRSR